PQAKGHHPPTKITAPLPTFDYRTGIYRCNKRGCLNCQSITHGRSQVLDSQGNSYHIRQFITCATDLIIYILTCPCKLLYVGRTTRPLRKRIGEHRRLIRDGCDKHSVPRHFLLSSKEFQSS
ncbi:unnamed protein product, partial [Staurois parvus]